MEIVNKRTIVTKTDINLIFKKEVIDTKLHVNILFLMFLHELWRNLGQFFSISFFYSVGLVKIEVNFLNFLDVV